MMKQQKIKKNDVKDVPNNSGAAIKWVIRIFKERRYDASLVITSKNASCNFFALSSNFSSKPAFFTCNKLMSTYTKI